MGRDAYVPGVVLAIKHVMVQPGYRAWIPDGPRRSVSLQVSAEGSNEVLLKADCYG